MPAKMPRGIWMLGFVSLLMDISSEMIHSLLPLFMVGSLGISALMVGVIEGLAEATALIVKIFPGRSVITLASAKVWRCLVMRLAP